MSLQDSWMALSPKTRTFFKTITVIFGAIATFCASWKAWGDNGWPYPAFEPYESRYVDGRIAEMKVAQGAVLRTLRDVQIEQAQGKLEATENSLATWKLQREKANDDNSKGLIDQRIRELKSTEEHLNKQIDTLQMFQREEPPLRK